MLCVCVRCGVYQQISIPDSHSPPIATQRRQHQVLKTKSTKDVIEFYYVWKMTSHYQQWKKAFEPMEPHPFHIAAPDA